MLARMILATYAGCVFVHGLDRGSGHKLFMSAGAVGGATCVNQNNRAKTTKYNWKAPANGAATLSVLCGHFTGIRRSLDYTTKPLTKADRIKSFCGAYAQTCTANSHSTAYADCAKNAAAMTEGKIGDKGGDTFGCRGAQHACVVPVRVPHDIALCVCSAGFEFCLGAHYKLNIVHMYMYTVVLHVPSYNAVVCVSTCTEFKCARLSLQNTTWVWRQRQHPASIASMPLLPVVVSVSPHQSNARRPSARATSRAAPTTEKRTETQQHASRKPTQWCWELLEQPGATVFRVASKLYKRRRKKLY